MTLWPCRYMLYSQAMILARSGRLGGCDGLFSFIVCWVRYGSRIRIRYGIGYGTDTSLFLLLLSVNVICDLYFDSHILVVLIITLILFMLLVLNVYMWESVIIILSLPTSHFSSCCCESTLSLCTPISILLLCYWPPTYCCSCCLSLWLWSIGSWHTWHPRHPTIGCLLSL